jgi:hypothetical protein
MTLEEYIKNQIDKGIIDFSVRFVTREDKVGFYIHPSNQSGDTADFGVRGNVLTSESIYDTKKTLLWQMHHQFKDHTVFVSQKELPDPHKLGEIESWLRKVQKHYPLPKGAKWLICNERSPQFSVSDPVTKERTENA